jgi:hypothetical protein
MPPAPISRDDAPHYVWGDNCEIPDRKSLGGWLTRHPKSVNPGGQLLT